MKDDLEEALNILNSALIKQRWPLSEAKLKPLIDLRDELLHSDQSMRHEAIMRIQADSRSPFAGEKLEAEELASLSPTPPPNAEFLFHLFLPPQNCDALVGDLEERYKLIRKKFGRRHANFWYWTQTALSLRPIIWAWAKKVSMKPVVAAVGWAVTKRLIGHDGWFATVVELLKRVRQ